MISSPEIKIIIEILQTNNNGYKKVKNLFLFLNLVFFPFSYPQPLRLITLQRYKTDLIIPNNR